MASQIAEHLLPQAASACFALLLALYAASRRGVPGARWLAVVLATSGLSTAGFVAEQASPTLAGKLLWDDAEFVCVFGWAGATFGLARALSGVPLARPRLVAATVSAPGAIYLALLATDSWHGLIRPWAKLTPGEPFGALVYPFTAATWTVTAVYMAVFVAALALLFAHAGPGRWSITSRNWLVAVAFLIPIAGFLMTLWFDGSPFGQRDVSPYTYALSNLLLAWVVLRHRLLDVVPIARSALLEQMTDGVLVLDARDRVVDTNERVTAWLGRSPLGAPASEALTAWPALAELCAAGAGRADLAWSAHGEPERTFDVSVSLIDGGAGEPAGKLVVLHEVTETRAVERELRLQRERIERRRRERLEQLVHIRTEELVHESAERESIEQLLRQVQKLDALGTLTSGVAHDFNNLLVVILNYAELAELGLESAPTQVRTALTRIKEAGNRAAALTRKLLIFGRQTAADPAAVDLTEGTEDALRLILRLLPSHLTIERRLEPAGAVWLAVGELDQILMNLCVNARDAMPDGGVLTVGARRCAPNDPASPEACVWVRDTGSGIDPATRERIFDPFFTTKALGAGTGLGLSIVRRIVEQRGGRIELDSTPGEGTEFRVVLPAYVPAPGAPAPAPPGDAPGSREATLLVVDDDPLVLEVLVQLLEQAGYRVVACGDGREALEQYREHSDEIDLVVTDAVMPRMTGKALYDALAPGQPELPFLVCSGYASGTLSPEFFDNPLHGFLPKPFTEAALLSAVDALLEAASPQAPAAPDAAGPP